MVAAQDGTVIAIGHNHALGRYVILRNAFGDHFAYGNLASVSAWYPTPKLPKPSAQILSAAVPSALAPGPRPTTPASAGAQRSGKAPPARLFGARSTPRRRARRAAARCRPVATINLRSKPSASTLFTPLAVLERDARAARRR